MTESEDYEQESRNLIRLLTLIEKCMPYAADVGNETAEISQTLLSGARLKKGTNVSNVTLKYWYARFNDGNMATFEAETAGLEIASTRMPKSCAASH
ncbi:hypothetical protein [Nitrospira sp. Ecomares 2.1]